MPRTREDGVYVKLKSLHMEEGWWVLKECLEDTGDFDFELWGDQLCYFQLMETVDKVKRSVWSCPILTKDNNLSGNLFQGISS